MSSLPSCSSYLSPLYVSLFLDLSLNSMCLVVIQLFGHEIVAPIVGLTYGLGKGFAIVCLGTFLGEIGNFLYESFLFFNIPIDLQFLVSVRSDTAAKLEAIGSRKKILSMEPFAR